MRGVGREGVMCKGVSEDVGRAVRMDVMLGVGDVKVMFESTDAREPLLLVQPALTTDTGKELCRLCIDIFGFMVTV